MQIGIFAKTFTATGAFPVLKAVGDAGYDVAQFNMACVGLPSMPDVIAPELAEEIAKASAATGVAIAAVSGTYNMIHPDPAMRVDGLDRLASIIRAAPLMGTRLVTLCTGTRDPHDQWKHHPENASKEAWRDLLEEMAKAVTLAEVNGIDLGIEPELSNLVSSAEQAHRLMSEMQSPRLRIVLDPANLFEIATVDESRTIIARAADILGDRIAMAHAKDRRADGGFVAAGKGRIDFPHFIRCLRSAGFAGPLVTHGLHEDEAAGVAAFLREIISK
ncbi:MAG: sugar phosphate isomerase/epimerase [Aestuariivirga sp.]